MMNDEKETLTREWIELDRRYREHIARHGFEYADYLSPAPGSFMDHYKRRAAEINAVLAPELKDPGEGSD